jgi:hypothetical protein
MSDEKRPLLTWSELVISTWIALGGTLVILRMLYP